MSETDAGMMAMVNEIHRLRNENESLRRLFGEQEVRIDQMVEAPLTYGLKQNLRWIEVDVDQLDVLQSRDLVRTLADQLSSSLLSQINRIAQKVQVLENTSRAVRYRFAFISLGGK